MPSPNDGPTRTPKYMYTNSCTHFFQIRNYDNVSQILKKEINFWPTLQKMSKKGNIYVIFFGLSYVNSNLQAVNYLFGSVYLMIGITHSSTIKIFLDNSLKQSLFKIC